MAKKDSLTEHLKTHYTYWYVKNATNEPISITTVPGHLMSILTIISGDSVCFHSFCPPQHWGIPSFNGLYDIWKKTAVQDQHTDILSNEGSLLKSWNYADRDAEERQFFNESYWRLFIKNHNSNMYLLVRLHGFLTFSPQILSSSQMP